MSVCAQDYSKSSTPAFTRTSLHAGWYCLSLKMPDVPDVPLSGHFHCSFPALVSAILVNYTRSIKLSTEYSCGHHFQYRTYASISAISLN